VAHAVRCVRNAVARRTYAQSGRFTYRRGDVQEFVAAAFPEHLEFVRRLYRWKCDADTRAVMVSAFRADPAPLYREFKALTPVLETAVRSLLDDV
jgi:hypothetical protein